jgi:hypothetical protein
MGGESQAAPQPRCDACGQPIPPLAKLAASVDRRLLCLACTIRQSQLTKGLKH